MRVRVYAIVSCCARMSNLDGLSVGMCASWASFVKGKVQMSVYGSVHK